MRKLLFIVLVFVQCAAHCFAADNNAMLWQKANNFYNQKQYDSAQYYYEQLAATQPQHAELYYNLGNTYYKLNKVALAVLNYERAIAINPDYTAAKDNLLLTQSRIPNNIAPAGEIFFIRWWHAAIRADRANGLAIISLVLFTLFILLLLNNKVRKGKGMRLPAQVSGIVFFVFLCFLLLAFASAHHATSHDSGVVMVADAPLMNSELKGKPLLLVPEGTTVSIRQQKGDWIEVRLPDGRSGWLQAATLEKI